MNFNKGFAPCDILLPEDGLDPAKWAVIACDQYTSQPDYWKKVAEITGAAPSTLNLIQPEADLEHAAERYPFVRESMQRYLSSGILKKKVSGGLILTLRRTASGLRPGLVGAVDLDAYDFAPGNKLPVRASEGTIIERLPPRIKIREEAAVECPHIMLLADDPGETLVEQVWKAVSTDVPLYDFELMLGGGHLTGWKVERPELLRAIDNALDRLYDECGGFLLAVGDGNHSLATAKKCWEKLKPSLSEEEQKVHPARFALAEIVNLHCPALYFRPIHRCVFGASAEQLLDSFSSWLTGRGLSLADGDRMTFFDGTVRRSVCVCGGGNVLDTVYLQPWLDEFLKVHPEASVDYVHGEEALREVSAARSGTGIELGTIEKQALFPSVEAGGVLPRKSFSMGEADEKRFYMEVRQIR